MKKSKAEKKVYAFNAIFRVDVNDVKPFQNPTGTSLFDHILDPQSMPRLFKTINPMFDSNFAFIDLFQLFTTGGQVGYAHTKLIM